MGAKQAESSYRQGEVSLQEPCTVEVLWATCEGLLLPSQERYVLYVAPDLLRPHFHGGGGEVCQMGKEIQTGSIDDFLRQVAADELEDKAETVTHLPVIEYARLRGMTPQKVYYTLRNHKKQLQTETCKCGRQVLCIEKADEYFKIKKATDVEAEEDGSE
jgi:hypothetical protein